MRKKITMNVATPTIQEAIDLFIRKCRVKNLSEKTITTYSIHLKMFSEYHNGTLEEISKDIVDDYIMSLKDKVNDTTVNSYLRSVRVFLYYCMDCNYIPKFKINMIKVDKKIKETYTTEELQRLLVKPEKSSFAEYRTWVFINYLLATGNRLSTALDLKIKDINFDDGTITLCKTKSRKQQIIPLSKSISVVLKEYLAIRGGVPEDYVFCNVYGEKAAPRSYQDMVSSYNIKRGVNKTSIHLFRHTFAKQWILAGGDVFRLQKILGHSDLTVTREYVNMFGQDLQLDFDRFNPLDNIKQERRSLWKKN